MAWKNLSEIDSFRQELSKKKNVFDKSVGRYFKGNSEVSVCCCGGIIHEGRKEEGCYKMPSRIAQFRFKVISLMSESYV